MGNYLTFDGLKTTDYGVEISGEGIFNSPERVYNMVEIPGRNGALAIDSGRFANIEVTYPAYNYEPDLTTFADRLRAIRNDFGCRIGYKRLEDTLHADEYRLAVFKKGFEIDPVKYNTASQFDITFDCKPQRFLKSGETAVDVSTAAQQIISGDPLTFYYDSNATVNSLDGSFSMTPLSSGTPTPNHIIPFVKFNTFTVSLNGSNSSVNLGGDYIGGNIDFLANTVTPTAFYYAFDGTETITYNTGTKQFQTTLTVPSTFTNGKCSHFNVTWPIHENSYEMMMSLTGTTLTLTWYCPGITSAAAMTAAIVQWDSDGTPMEIGGDITGGTATSITVSPALSYSNGINTLEALYGWNNLITFDIDITSEVVLTNPTNFEAKPLLDITGTGTLVVGDATITISGNGDQMYLDCDLCEAWSESGGVLVNRNSDVAMSGADFPTLKPGGNVITADNTLTQILVTPRWWII